MTMRAHHPALGLAVPGVSDLRSRCDEEADRVLELAASLAAYRLREEEDLRQHVERVQAAPWSEPTWHTKGSHVGLTPTDLRRALLGLHAEEFECLAYVESGVTDEFREAVRQWEELASQPPLGTGEALEPRWGRRWALAIDRDPGFEIDLSLLMGAALYPPDQAVFDFDPMYFEGMITDGEAEARIRWQLGQFETRVLHALRPAYLDDSGAMESLDAALRCGPAAVVVGSESSGRSHLATAFHETERQRRGQTDREPDWNLRMLFAGVPQQPLEWSSVERGESRFALLALLDGIDEGQTPRWRFSDGERRDLHALLRMAHERPDQVRVVVLTQPQQLVRLAESIPDLLETPWIETAMRREDWLPIWACHMYASEDRRMNRIKAWDLLAVWDQHVSKREARDVISEVSGLRTRWEPERTGLFYCDIDRLVSEIDDLSWYLRRSWRSFVFRSRRNLARNGELAAGRQHDAHRGEVLLDALGQPERLLEVLELVKSLRVT
jgi:hypothetical protein